ncbi:major capsid protein [Citricoccus sp.]|uniref:major capsid protein n=1 Tax=Citricoccus sp. TaxID=1978372 RepID=UPI0028BE0020|nr:phage capsid protein [Citricoccus sp.]
MPVTLAQASQNATEAVDITVIDEFRTSAMLEQMIFDDVVSPAGGGATLSYGYRRKETMGTAQFRAINSEYTPSEATTSKHSTELKVLGGSFQIDRVLAKVGPAASNEVSFQMSDKIQAARAQFSDAVINGDSAVDEDSFDGLSKALAGSTTEVPAGTIDWSGALDETSAFGILEDLDELLALMDGEPTLVLSNKLALARIRSAARRTSMYVREPGPRNTYVERYGNAILFDAGKKAGTNADIIPVTAGTTDLYGVRIALDGFHGVSTVGGQLVQQWLPDFTKAGAVKTGEVEMGPVGVALKKTKAAAVARGVRLAAA